VAPHAHASLFVVNAFDDEEVRVMQRKHKTIAAAGAVGLAGLVGAVAAAPAMTAAAVSAVTSTSTDRVQLIADALAGMVEDGTLTREQADAVAQTLAEQLPAHGPGGVGKPRGHAGVLLELDAAAEELGLTEQELREQLHDGATLAEIAEEQGVEVDDLVNAIVDAAKENLAAAVDDGRIDQERADEIAADLEDRVRTFVEEGFPAAPDGLHRHGPGPWGGRDDTGQDTDPESTSQATPSAV
jgi:polyhydroxyalkanoate synthesis regulator phasin